MFLHKLLRPMTGRFSVFALTFASVFMLAGCGGGYLLQGKAVSGDFASVMFLPADDEMLASTGVGKARLTVYRDAGRPNQSLVATGISDGRGGVSISLDAFGAGWMQEQWLIEVVKPGFETIESIVTLPPAEQGMQMLIIMSPGQSLPPRGLDTLWDEAERYR